MNRPTHKQALWAGLAILFAVNAIAFVGAAWNRGGVESQLGLSQRELDTPYAWQSDREDSGVALTLRWRAPPSGVGDSAYLSPYSYYGMEPGWLDGAKLAALGFDVAAPPADAENREWRRHARRVTLVLELDGPAYARSLELADKAASEAKAKSAAAPGDESLASRAKEALDNLKTEQTRASRLFAVDAGLDRDALRAKYPDRRHYALVPALVQLYWQKDAQTGWKVTGNIQRLLNPRIHLSRAQAQALASAIGRNSAALYSDQLGVPFDVDLAWGRRLEPWVVSAHAR